MANNNNLEQLNDILFESLRSIQSADPKSDSFSNECEKARQVVSIASRIQNGMKIGLDSVRIYNEYYGRDIPMPKMLEAGDDEE